MKGEIKKTIQSLEDNGFNVEYFEEGNKAVDKLLEEIPAHASVGMGGSVTLNELGVYEKLSQRGNSVYWHHKCSPEEKQAILKKATTADVYLSSTNALTMDGKLINIDGTGNRVAHMFWGHEKIFIVAGINKIAEDYEKGIHRIKTIACPKNAERLNFDVPCRYKGKCMDCKSPQRMCRIETVIERQPMNGKVYVYIVNESLGY